VVQSTIGEKMRPLLIIAVVLLSGCSTARVIPDEASSAVPSDYVTKHQLPVSLERAALILSHLGHTGDELVFVDTQGKKFTVYHLLAWRKDTPLFSPSREVGRLAVGDSQLEIRLVDYLGDEGRAVLQILSSVPREHEGFGIANECVSVLKKKRATGWSSQMQSHLEY
jgi:hypothetical protein